MMDFTGMTLEEAKRLRDLLEMLLTMAAKVDQSADNIRVVFDALVELGETVQKMEARITALEETLEDLQEKLAEKRTEEQGH
jgi:hypothetical protein